MALDFTPQEFKEWFKNANIIVTLEDDGRLFSGTAEDFVDKFLVELNNDLDDDYDILAEDRLIETLAQFGYVVYVNRENLSAKIPRAKKVLIEHGVDI